MGRRVIQTDSSIIIGISAGHVSSSVFTTDTCRQLTALGLYFIIKLLNNVNTDCYGCFQISDSKV